MFPCSLLTSSRTKIDHRIPSDSVEVNSAVCVIQNLFKKIEKIKNRNNRLSRSLDPGMAEVVKPNPTHYIFPG